MDLKCSVSARPPPALTLSKKQINQYVYNANMR